MCEVASADGLHGLVVGLEPFVEVVRDPADQPVTRGGYSGLKGRSRDRSRSQRALLLCEVPIGRGAA